ncbi:MAG: bifunctional diguanylate cyclase/phosphodiesterase, partial [Kofleriaceae bacterium]|nr:bifunctional diguanylate cyclase/phosphodiesterase [Kofleriaceae bacterium]
LGGDEFAVLIPDIQDEGQLGAPAARIIEALEPTCLLNGHQLHITASIGIAIYPENGETIEDLVESADSAMYRAKENGRNNYQFFDEDMHAQAIGRMELERDLQGALERDEFVLFFQPLLNVKTGELKCFEALLRWQHPRLGLVQPDEFIPLLEDRGLIVPVGEWVLERACQQVSEWNESFGTIGVAVNVSPRQFDDPGLVDAVTRALDKSGLSASQLELEVTENLVMRNIDTAVDKLQELKKLGVRIAVDDFGTGQSQLVYLVRFPVDTLKIDKSVTQMIGSREGNMIAKMVVDMGHNLGLELVAEGVETEAQLEFVAELGCQVYQGYLSTRPLAPEDCVRWLEERMPDDEPFATPLLAGYRI